MAQRPANQEIPGITSEALANEPWYQALQWAFGKLSHRSPLSDGVMEDVEKLLVMVKDLSLTDRHLYDIARYCCELSQCDRRSVAVHVMTLARDKGRMSVAQIEREFKNIVLRFLPLDDVGKEKVRREFMAAINGDHVRPDQFVKAMEAGARLYEKTLSPGKLAAKQLLETSEFGRSMGEELHPTSLEQWKRTLMVLPNKKERYEFAIAMAGVSLPASEAEMLDQILRDPMSRLDKDEIADLLAFGRRYISPLQPRSGMPR